jgi:hypothetical protein
MQVRNGMRNAILNGLLFGEPRKRCHHSEGANDAGANVWPSRCSVTSHNIRDKSTVTICQVREPNRLAISGEHVRFLRRIAHSKNVRVARALILIHPNCARVGHSQPGGDGERAICLNADGRNNNVGIDLSPI